MKLLRRSLIALPLLPIAFFLSATAASHGADALKVEALHVQQAGDTCYFLVRFAPPADMASGPVRFGSPGPQAMANVEDLARQPRLVPQDTTTRAVYHRLEIVPDRRPGPGSPPPETPPPVQRLEFVGKCSGVGRARLRLIYPIASKSGWAEVPVTLDLAAARKKTAARDKLARVWAIGQATEFARLEVMTPDFSFYGFARQATGRKYGVPAPALLGGRKAVYQPQLVDQQLYELTTGAAAITESLQQKRLLNPGTRDTGERKIKIDTLPGIDIAAHPWQKLMSGRQPEDEPLARLVPRDFYYLHFKDVRKLLTLGDLLDSWGSELVRLYEFNSRDAHLRQRYEKQLCLGSTALGRLLGPAVVRELAVTGSDPYLREGSDVTLLFRVRNQAAFLAAVQPFLSSARREFGQRLHEEQAAYHGVAIQSFATPLREVSLYRASLDDVMIYSNSLAALRRILDARQGRVPALADAGDFRYMRTVFRASDPSEDGFLFLSDPFIRQLVGPASKIKEKRRLEALTSLTMLSNGVLFTAWETASLPADRRALLTASGLKSDEVYAPGGQDVAWDPDQHLAVSDVYNTLEFATPLLELPIERVTAAEAQGYERFRLEYLGLWRTYFDPIGIRLGLRDGQVRVETYILPLIQSSAYGALQNEVGGGTVAIRPRLISPHALAQLTSHINLKGSRAELTSLLSIMDGKFSFDFLGDWFMVRLDDSPIYSKLASLYMEDKPELANLDPREAADLLFQVPLSVGVEIRRPGMLAALLGGIRATVLAALPGAVNWGPMEPAYRGVHIVRIQTTMETVLSPVAVYAPRQQPAERPRPAGKKSADPAIYYALVHGVFYASLREEALKELIDAALDARQDKKGRAETVAVNSSLYLAPGAAVHSGGAIRALLEAAIRERALANTPILYVLYHTGLVKPETPPAEVATLATKYFGFVPVSPDGSPYVYEPATDVVRNHRHGTLAHPIVHKDMAAHSSFRQLFDSLNSLRADLRFREDGLQTTLTMDRTRQAP